MAEFFPNLSYLRSKKPQETSKVEDSYLTKFGAALKQAEKYDPSLKKVPLQQSLSIILNENQPNYGALPLDNPDLKGSRDDRNTVNLGAKLVEDGIDPDAAHAVASLSTANKFSQRNKTTLPFGWNRGGDPNIDSKVKGVSDALNAVPKHKMGVLDAFHKGYTASMTEDTSGEGSPSLLKQWQDHIRDFTGGGY